MLPSIQEIFPQFYDSSGVLQFQSAQIFSGGFGFPRRLISALYPDMAVSIEFDAPKHGIHKHLDDPRGTKEIQ